MEIQKALLTFNSFSRPGTKIDKITNIVIHWVGNAGSTAIANRNYFESLKDKGRYASSHYIIGLDGEIVQCVPENEVAYHGNSANNYSIGIENCHPDWTGKFNDKTYASLIELCADICKRYDLDPQKALLRHYDVTYKDCPHYYVLNHQAWLQLKNDVSAAMAEEDTELLDAIKHIIASGIQLDINSWCSKEVMQLSNVNALLNRLGGLDKLIADGIIIEKEKWITGQYKANDIRWLLIKFYKSLN